jgi:hypothetical protein
MNSITKKDVNFLRTANKNEDTNSELDGKKELKKTYTYTEAAKVAINEEDQVNMSEFSNFEIELNISEADKKNVNVFNFSFRMVGLKVRVIGRYITLGLLIF